MTKWKQLPVPEIGADYEGHFRRKRLNSLGSLYYFTKHTLGKDRLTTFHRHLCASLEVEDLFLVMEVPMSHFKTTLGIGLSIWWALPFSNRDEDEMGELGYTAAWIRWMKLAHNQNTRTLVTHEIADQAAAIGKAVDDTYDNNDLFIQLFREILPDKDCTWTNHHKFQKRLPGGDPTTGTYEYRGVGQALQGIHVNSIIQDDNFGRAAQTSLLKGDGGIVHDLINWHKQVGTRFDPMVKKNRRQLVIGNAWAHADLNEWIKKHQPEFKFETHSAEGGCCDLHAAGDPILPEEWSLSLLHKEKRRLEAGGDKGDYEHFYLNLHTLPGEKIFKKEDLNYFRFKQSRPDLNVNDLRNILLLEHEVRDGEVIEDFQPGGLEYSMIVGVKHAKRQRCVEHCIWVIGYESDSTRIYLLDLWAEDSSYSDLVDKVYATGRRWRLDGFWMGNTAFELLKFYLDQRDRIETRPLRVRVLADDESEGSNQNRIESLEPIFKNRQVWCHRSHEKFLDQFEMYPAGNVDTLSTLGYFTGTVSTANRKEWDVFMSGQREQFANRSSGSAGY